ncbi:hypothetical protein [Aestuariivita boseongensis]|uniref:hypothetical protein n=1 Tax=Aestuariivita boseongensis TaxID=1470562 RepID=UPI00068242BE|nr:hypothetical protein [Aestuariivita boseongensis]
MRFQRVLSAALVATVLGAVPGMAMDAKIYPYASKQNFCPQGLQPVTISGVICCGTPNQSQSYQSMMQQSGSHKRSYRAASSRADCPPGVKGCG